MSTLQQYGSRCIGARLQQSRRPLVASGRRVHRAPLQATKDQQEGPSSTNATQGSSPDAQGTSSGVDARVTAVDLDKEVTKFARNAATTFAPRASGATGKNPATRGTLLYTVFEVQAWVCLAVGGLLSFNVLFPSDEPSVWRLMGMWSIWMFTIPSLRARDCTAAEKDALNYLFLLVPLINVGIPFFAKSFPLIYTADVAAMAAVFAWKGLVPGINQATDDTT